MKTIISMTLLMLSFSSFSSELSTLTTYINLGKDLSPTFYEDVMSNLKKVKVVCNEMPQTKTQLLNELKGNAVTTKDYLAKKEQLEQLPKSITQSLERQINKLKAAKKHVMFTPSCLTDDLGTSLLGFAEMTGLTSINEQFIFAIDYLKEIQARVDETTWANGYEVGSVTQKEKDAYAFCSSRLDELLKGVKYE